MFRLISLFGLVFIGVQCINDDILQSSANPNKGDSDVKNIDVFRQLLNQETIIRMNLEQKVQQMMADLSTLKEKTVAGGKTSMNQLPSERDIRELKVQVEWLKTENNALKNLSVVGEREILFLKEKLRIVVSQLTENQRFDTNTHSEGINDKIQELQKRVQDSELKILANVAKNTAAISELETQHLIYKATINNSISSLQASLDQYESNLGSNQTISKLDNLTKIGFTASVASSNWSWNSGTLVFPNVISNVGNGYNPSDGVFTAPMAGVYVFFVNVQSYVFNTIYVDIVLNGMTKVRTMAYSYDGKEAYEAGPNLAVLSLQIGDRVWVKHHSGKGYYYVGPITTFSGFMI